MERIYQNKSKVIKWTVMVLLLVWLIWSNVTVQLTALTVVDKDLPAGFNGYKIAQVSDLHNAQFGQNNSALIKLLKEQAPDIIVITGDVVDSERTNVDAAVNFAKQAAEIAPCYYVTGNHEGWLKDDHEEGGAEQYDKLEQAFVQTGVSVLHDEAILLEQNGQRIQLIGMDDPTYRMEVESAPFRSKLQELRSEDKFTVLLSHRPELFETYVKEQVDLVFTGHAHGGQVRIPFVGGLVAPGQGFLPEYDAGTYTDGTTTMVVSRGIGNSMVPIRVNNRPELVVVELQNDEQE